MKTILVTGAAGFIGSHLVDRLLLDGNQVVAVDDLSTGDRKRLPSGISFEQVSVTDQNALRKVFEKHRPSLVIHEAAKINTNVLHENSCVDTEITVLGTLNLAQLSLEFGVSKFVFASSVAVYGEPRQSDLPVVETSPLEPIYSYGIAKKCAEEYLAYFAKTRGLSYVALRYGNIFGPRQPIYGEVGVAAIFSDRIRRGLPLTVFGSGKQTRDFLYVADAVDATVKSLSYAGNGVFNVASGRGTTVDELVVAFESAVGKPLEIRREAARHAELTHFHCSNRLAMDSLAWTPKVSIGDGVKLTLAEMV